jgi:tRNA pseudouridine13 synthase
MRDPWPCSTESVAPVAGAYKLRPEDFRVEEIPAYSPVGEGEHVLFEIEKRGLTTHAALDRIGRALGIASRALGVAGLKDARGVTRQWISAQGVARERVEALDLRGIRVISAGLHRNKLRIGHLRGNRFTIRLREVDPSQLGRVREILVILARRGVPNYFGEQRFGIRSDTWRIGRALLLGDVGEAVATIAGRAGPLDRGRIRHARERFDAGDYLGAAEAWPGGFRVCVRICRAMAKSGGDARRALRVVDRTFLRFYTSSYQSWLFNQVLAERLSGIDRVLDGDLAWLHRNGAVFLVRDAEAEMPRVERLEISASGPLFGRRMSRPAGRPLEIELAVLAREGHAEEAFSRPGPYEWQGARRPLRFPLADESADAGTDEHGAFFELAFTLPPGCYATAVLREILQRDVAVGAGDPGESREPDADPGDVEEGPESAGDLS